MCRARVNEPGHSCHQLVRTGSLLRFFHCLESRSQLRLLKRSNQERTSSDCCRLQHVPTQTGRQLYHNIVGYGEDGLRDLRCIQHWNRSIARCTKAFHKAHAEMSPETVRQSKRTRPEKHGNQIRSGAGSSLPTLEDGFVEGAMKTTELKCAICAQPTQIQRAIPAERGRTRVLVDATQTLQSLEHVCFDCWAAHAASICFDVAIIDTCYGVPTFGASYSYSIIIKLPSDATGWRVGRLSKQSLKLLVFGQ